MKKIGVITSYFATNFGAALQCYALKSVLENLGFDVDYIRYKQKNLYRMFYPFHIGLLKTKSPITLFKRLRSLPEKKQKWDAFKRFRVGHIQSDTSFITIIPQDKDYYILGSDQIWNPHITRGYDNVFWGQFPHPSSSKVFSYAASTENMVYTPQNKAFIKKALCSLSHVSVREDWLNQDLTEISGRTDIKTVIDPTLLADVAIYENLPLCRPLNEKFVLFYKIRKCTSFIPKVNEYAKQIGAKVLLLSSSIEDELKAIAKKDENIVYLPLVGVETFLSAVKFAEHVFTPSFHGTAFSIIFHKRFHTIVLEDNWNNRTADLLEKLCLSNRRLKIQDPISLSDPDYQSADSNLQQLRQESMSFLYKALDIS